MNILGKIAFKRVVFFLIFLILQNSNAVEFVPSLLGLAGEHNTPVISLSNHHERALPAKTLLARSPVQDAEKELNGKDDLNVRVMTSENFVKGDWIIIDNERLTDVYIRESSSLYYVQVVKDASTIVVRKSNVKADEVFISRNQKDRAKILEEWNAKYRFLHPETYFENDPEETEVRSSDIQEPNVSTNALEDFKAQKELEKADTRGRTVETQYISCHNGIVRMKNAEGKTYRVPMWTLSQQDQMFVVKKKGWAVVKAERQANVKASLTVRLAERVTKEMLVAIANELHGFADNKQPRLFIVYYLPDMEIDAGGWATTHFNPDLEVKILGATKEEHEKIVTQTKTSEVSQKTIGSWTVTILPTGTITFFRKDGQTYLTRRYNDGSSGTDELVIQKVGGQTRYRQSGGHPADYFIITASGDLGHCNDEGMWAKSKKMK